MKTKIYSAIFALLAMCVSFGASAQCELKLKFKDNYGVGEEVRLNVPADKVVKLVKSKNVEELFLIWFEGDIYYTSSFFYLFGATISWNGTSVDGKDVYFVYKDFSMPLKDVYSITLKQLVIDGKKEYLEVNTQTGERLFPLAEIEECYFMVKKGSGIDDVNTKSLNACVTDGVLNVSAENPLGNVSLYGVNGKMVFSTSTSGNTMSQAVSLPQGLYILRVGDIAKKIMVNYGSSPQ